MSADAYSPITTSRQLEMPQGHRIYTTTRRVPAEYPIPSRGVTMSLQLGAGSPYAANIIIDVRESPEGDGKRLTLDHTAIPTGSHEQLESMAHTFPPIYNPGGYSWLRRSRVVPARVVYEYAVAGATLTTWRNTDKVVWDPISPSTNTAAAIAEGTQEMNGPFMVYTAMPTWAATNFTTGDGGTGVVGQFLNQAFIAEDTINNSFTIYSPDGNLSATLYDSLPSATEYLAWRDARRELMVSRNIDSWYGSIYQRRTVWVRAQ